MWETIKIDSLGKVVTGKTPSTKQPEYYGGDYPFITPTDMAYDARIVSTERTLSDKGYATQKNSILPAGSICFVCIASIGKICMTQSPSFSNQQINSIVINERKHNKFFIYYLLRTQSNRVKSIASGAATPIVNKTTFASLDVSVPTLDIQNKIASILSAYDDLIENNLKRIKILEEMAQMIYREWFVNFRFPGHEKVKMVDSPLGKIPEGWEVKLTGDELETLGGGTPSTIIEEYWTDADVTWYTPSDITKNKMMFIHNSEKKINKFGLQKSSARMFPAYSVMMTSRATIGEFAINTTPACTNQGFITCIPTERLSAYYILFVLIEMKEKIIALSGGATYKEINKTTFRKINIIIPDRQIMDDFTDTLAPIMHMMENLQLRNANLRKTRDLLLPKLISGEIDVEGLDIRITA